MVSRSYGRGLGIGTTTAYAYLGQLERQLPRQGGAVLALDAIEHGMGRSVPLWGFGFLS